MGGGEILTEPENKICIYKFPTMLENTVLKFLGSKHTFNKSHYKFFFFAIILSNLKMNDSEKNYLVCLLFIIDDPFFHACPALRNISKIIHFKRNQCLQIGHFLKWKNFTHSSKEEITKEQIFNYSSL